MIERATVVWVDANGRTTATLLDTSAGAAAVWTALAGKSNAGLMSTWEGALTLHGGAGVAAVYQSVSDSAQLVFTTGAGTEVSVAVPAPLASIFLADQETVDITQIGGIIAAVIANVTDPAGNAVTAYLAGTRVSRPRK